MDIPNLANPPKYPPAPRVRVAGPLPADEELIRIGKETLLHVAQDSEDDRSRVAAASHLIATARQDLALSGPGKAKTAAEMLEAVRRAIPELERRAAAEAGQLPPKDGDGEW